MSTMPSFGILNSLHRNRNFILIAAGLPTLVAALLSLALPKYYLSVTTAVPVNSRLTDKNRFVAKELQELYSVFGESDDLDRIYDLVRSASVANALCDSFSLTAHYGLDSSRPAARASALKKLMKNTEIMKTETGVLRVSVWDRSPETAASLANGYLTEADRLYRQLTTRLYADTRNRLEKKYQGMSLDTTHQDLGSLNQLQDQLSGYGGMISQLDLSLQTLPPAFLVIDTARPAWKPDRPDLLLNTLATLAISLFTCLTVLLLFPLNRTNDR
jgi:capsular polysaccharide biosynthesis protein